MRKVKRPVKIKSEQADKHNTRRREKYQQDTDYKEKLKDVARLNYRKSVSREFMSCSRNLGILGDLATVTLVEDEQGMETRLPILNIPRTADALDKLYQNVWRWVDKEMLPAPVLHTVTSNQPVYHKAEVEVFIRVLGEHFENFAYYRRDHESTRKQIFEKIQKVRTKLNLI